DVRSHTDSRSSDAFNMRLSDARAKSTVAYIIAAGIDRSRISGRGYGESQLLNRCSNGVPCSEEEHQLNRRSEFIIVAK
ncbi:MAG: OmpA family protein, partial [Bacteroidota bacterium]